MCLLPLQASRGKDKYKICIHQMGIKKSDYFRMMSFLVDESLGLQPLDHLAAPGLCRCLARLWQY